jgi:hypothetical protein
MSVFTRCSQASTEDICTQDCCSVHELHNKVGIVSSAILMSSALLVQDVHYKLRPYEPSGAFAYVVLDHCLTITGN